MREPVETLIARYKDRLFGAAFSVTQNQADAQDAVQNTFIKLYQNDPAFENEEHLRKWLFRTVYNQAKDIRRSFWHKNRVSLCELSETYHPEPGAERDLFEAVLRLKEKERIVLQLFYYENYSVKEMAEILHLREATVRKQLSRARQALKHLLDEEPL